MKILVTGSAGYIGGTFSFEALKRGHEIIGIDNFSNSNKRIPNVLKDKFDSRWEKNTSVYESALNSDAILLLTDWDEFYEMDLKKLFANMRIPCWIFDTRNIINSKEAKSLGFNLWKLGNG